MSFLSPHFFESAVGAALDACLRVSADLERARYRARVHTDDSLRTRVETMLQR